MNEPFYIVEARRFLYKFLDHKLLSFIDTEIFWSQDAEDEVKVELVDVGYDVSTYGIKKEAADRFTFTDAIEIQEIIDQPTGDSHKTYESRRGMAATTHGDKIYAEAQTWCDEWWEFNAPGTIFDLDDLWEDFGEAGLTVPFDWYNQLEGTLGDLRSRCND